MNSENPSARLLWLDAVRGIAALSVVIYHARSAMWVGLQETWAHYGVHPNLSALVGYLTTPFMFGHLGVELFFVVSGLSIHLRGARDLALLKKGARLDVGRFWMRRFLRLYPTYVAAFLLTVGVDSYLIAHFPDTVAIDHHDSESFFATLFGLQGIIAPFFGSADVFWTLVLEMHLYLAYPLLFLLSRTKGPEVVFCVTLVVQALTAGALHVFQAEETWPFWHAGGPLFLKFWFTWTVGFYLAEILAGRAVWGGLFAVYVGAPLLAVGLILVAVSRFDLAEVPIAMGFGWLLLATSRVFPRLLGRWLTLSLIWLGVVSYSLYATHFPLLRLTRAVLNEALPSASTWMLVAGVVVAVLTAFAFHYGIDRWSIKLSHWATSSRRPKPSRSIIDR